MSLSRWQPLRTGDLSVANADIWRSPATRTSGALAGSALSFGRSMAADADRPDGMSATRVGGLPFRSKCGRLAIPSEENFRYPCRKSFELRALDGRRCG